VVANPNRPARRWLRRTGIAIGALVAVGVVGLLVMAILPVSTTGLGATPNPAPTYAAATARFAQVQKDDAAARPVCRSRLLTEGRRTARVVVLFHGLTNCPRQMLDLAKKLHADGANVLVLRTPGHGLPGGVENMADVSAEDFRDFAAGAVDMAEREKAGRWARLL
jgi:carboxylesterase